MMAMLKVDGLVPNKIIIHKYDENGMKITSQLIMISSKLIAISSQLTDKFTSYLDTCVSE